MQLRWITWYLLASLGLAGCGSHIESMAPPETVVVTGKAVLASGQPITGARIRFAPAEGATGAESYAELKADGSFTLQSFGGRDGTMPRAIVFLNDSAESPRIEPELLMELYRLSPAEARLAVTLRRMPDDADATAHQLFAVLRALDATGVKLIWVETPPDSPEWEGVRDRLQRAAA